MNHEVEAIFAVENGCVERSIIRFESSTESSGGKYGVGVSDGIAFAFASTGCANILRTQL